MAAWRQARRPSLSISLPDVSCDGANLSSSIQDIVPMPTLPASPARTAVANYNIDDDRWADKVDSSTGSVFFVDPPPRGSHHNLDSYTRPRSSSSCSSLSSVTSFPDLRPPSSMTSFSDLPPPPSPTMSLQSASLPERFSRSLQVPDSYSPGQRSPVYVSEAGVHIPETAVLPTKKTSSLKKIKKALKRKKSMLSGSLSDLNEMTAEPHVQHLPSFSEGESTGPPTPTSTVPEATLYGSHGLPLQSSYYSPVASRSHKSTTLVRVRLDISQFGLGIEQTPCSLDKLGIVPSRSLAKGKFGSTISLRQPKSSYPQLPEISQPVIIRGVVPGSPAAVTQQIYSGDTIHYVNGHSVNLDNIDAVLAGLSNEIMFVVKKGHYRPPSRLSQFSSAHGPTPGGLVRLVSGGKDVVRSHIRHSHQNSHLLLYLTLDTEEDDPSGKDILYQYPKVDSEDQSTVDSLVQVRGLFLTLSDLLGGITGSKCFCSSVTVEGRLLHLAYIKYDQELLLLALPQKLASPYQVKLLVEKISYTLRLLYGSVHNAFTSPSRHTSSLDHLFSLFFDSVSAVDLSRSILLDSSLPVLTALPQLKLPPDIKVRLSAALSDLDSADHSNRPEILHMRRPFILVGSCLFLKGALACSHLCDTDLRDVAQFCDAYRLPELTATESVNQIVVWKQVCLSRCTPSANTKQNSTRQDKHFILIVGLEHVFTCMLMEPTHPFEGHSPPSVDAVYVDRARSLILELKAQDLFMECEEKGLPSMPLPSLHSADIALASLFTRRASVSLAPLPPTPTRARKTSEPFAGSSPTIGRFKTSLRLDSSDSDDLGTERPDSIANSSPGPNRRRSQSLLNLKSTIRSKRRESLQQKLGATGSRHVPKGTLRPPYTLTSGVDNILLHYVHLSCGRGVMLCPTHPITPGPVQSELIRTFRETSLTIREVLHGRVEEGVCGVDSESDSDSDSWASDEEDEEKVKESVSTFAPRVSSVVEHGVLLQCGIHSSDKPRNTPCFNYWVVGRLLNERDIKTELYVCYQENMSQDCVEMAYRLLFGWTG